MKFLHCWQVLRFVGSLALSVTAACTSTSVSAPSQSATKCQVGLTAPQQALSASGGSGSFSVVAAAECQWTATSDAAWISSFAPASGQGPAQVRFTAAANPAAEVRQGEIKVNDAAARVNQEPAPCTFDVSPRTLTVASTASRGSLTMTTPLGCAWTSRPEVSWLTLVSPAQNTGPGPLLFDIALNTAGAPRIGSLSVAGMTVIVTQLETGCFYDLTPATQSVTAAGGAGSVALAAGPSCDWTAASDALWLTVTGSTSGRGNATLAFTATPNTGSPRIGRISVAGATATVMQGGASSCAFSVSPATQTMAAGGGTFSVSVATTPSCNWTAASSDPWVQITPTLSSGPGTAQVTVLANTGAARSSTGVIIAGQLVTVNQASTSACTYTLLPPGATVGGGSGGGSIAVDTQVNCPWSANTTNTWLKVTGSSSGVGDGTVSWTYDANPAGATRTGAISVAGQSFVVNQAAACVFTVNPSGATFDDRQDRNGSFTVTASSPSCAWTAATPDGWVVIDNPSGVGSGQVRYNIDRNRTNVQRKGTIVISGQATFTITQEG